MVLLDVLEARDRVDVVEGVVLERHVQPVVEHVARARVVPALLGLSRSSPATRRGRRSRRSGSASSIASMIQPTPGPSSSTVAPSAGRAYGNEQLEEGVAPVGGPLAELLERDAVVDPPVEAVEGARPHPRLLVAVRIHLTPRCRGRPVLPVLIGGSNTDHVRGRISRRERKPRHYCGAGDRGWSCNPTCGSISPMRTSASRSASPRGCMSADEAARLHGFVDDGYLKFPIDLDDEFCAGVRRRRLADLWTERPDGSRGLAAGPDGPTAVRRLRRPGPRARVPHPRPAQPLRRTRSTSTCTRRSSAWSS